MLCSSKTHRPCWRPVEAGVPSRTCTGREQSHNSRIPRFTGGATSKTKCWVRNLNSSVWLIYFFWKSMSFVFCYTGELVCVCRKAALIQPCGETHTLWPSLTLDLLKPLSCSRCSRRDCEPDSHLKDTQSHLTGFTPPPQYFNGKKKSYTFAI